MLNKVKLFGKAFASKVASKSPVLCAVGGVMLTGGALFMMNRQTKKREEILDKYIQTRRQQIFDKAVKAGKDVETVDDIVFTVEDFTIKDKVKLGIKTYGVPVTMYLAGIGLSVTAVALLSKKLAAVAMSPVATTAIGCTNEVIADKAKKTIDEKLHGPEAERYRPKVMSGTGVEQGKGGTTLMYDSWSGRWFTSDPNTLKNVILEASEALLDDDSGVTCVTFSNIYDGLGISRSVSNDADGFSAGNSIEFDIEHCDLEDGTPYLKVIWKTEPERLF